MTHLIPTQINDSNRLLAAAQIYQIHQMVGLPLALVKRSLPPHEVSAIA